MTYERERAVRAFRRRMAELHEKEMRCPACAKARRLAAGGSSFVLAAFEVLDRRAPFVPVCDAHCRLRIQLTVTGRG